MHNGYFFIIFESFPKPLSKPIKALQSVVHFLEQISQFQVAFAWILHLWFDVFIILFKVLQASYRVFQLIAHIKNPRSALSILKQFLSIAMSEFSLPVDSNHQSSKRIFHNRVLLICRSVSKRDADESVSWFGGRVVCIFAKHFVLFDIIGDNIGLGSKAGAHYAFLQGKR